MARRTSPIEDLLNIASKLPRWGGVALAIISYFLLDYFLGKKLAPISGKQVFNTGFLLSNVGVTFADVF